VQETILKNKTNDVIFLPSILKSDNKDLMLCKNFVTVTGEICNNGMTKNQIDVILNCKEPEISSPLNESAKKRIIETFSTKNINKERLRFIYDDLSKLQQNHLNMYDLILRLKPTRRIIEMEQQKNGVSPFDFVINPKSLYNRFREQIHSPENVVEIIQSLQRWKDVLADSGIYVEKMFDGIKIQVHKQGNKIQILNDEKIDLTKKLPILISQLKKISDDFVLTGMLELHTEKTELSQLLNKELIEEKEKDIQFNVQDVLWLNEKDMSTKPLKERITLMYSILSTTENITPSMGRIVKTLDDLKKEVTKISEKSKGVILKQANSIYQSSSYTSQIIELQKEFSLNVKVTGILSSNDKDKNVYLTSIGDIPMGTTYKTNILANIGDKIKVMFTELSKHIDPGTREIWFDFWNPRVIEKAKNVDSLETANMMVRKTNGTTKEKSMPERYKGLLKEESYINEFQKKAILYDTEEFDMGLKNSWITKGLIPEQLAATMSEIRTTGKYLLKKEIGSNVLVCLRNSDNEITAQKTICLVENI